jgi:hypothetical protein
MVKIFDSEISTGSLLARTIAGLLMASLTVILLYLIPKILSTSFTKGEETGELALILSQIINPYTNILVVAVALLVLLTILLRKTRAEGPMLIGLGTLLFLYFYSLLHGGIINITFPESLLDFARIIGINIRMNITLQVNITAIMILFSLPSIMIIAKGLFLILKQK